MRAPRYELGLFGVTRWGLLACNAAWLGNHTPFTLHAYRILMGELTLAQDDR